MEEKDWGMVEEDEEEKWRSYGNPRLNPLTNTRFRDEKQDSMFSISSTSAPRERLYNVVC